MRAKRIVNPRLVYDRNRHLQNECRQLNVNGKCFDGEAENQTTFSGNFPPPANNRSPSIDNLTSAFPPELWEKVSKYLQAKDRRNLKMVNRSLYRIMENGMDTSIEFKRAFTNHFKSQGEVYLTEVCTNFIDESNDKFQKLVVITFRMENEVSKFVAKGDVFTQREMQQLNHSIRKVSLVKAWIDINTVS